MSTLRVMGVASTTLAKFFDRLASIISIICGGEHFNGNVTSMTTGLPTSFKGTA